MSQTREQMLKTLEEIKTYEDGWTNSFEKGPEGKKFTDDVLARTEYFLNMFPQFDIIVSFINNTIKLGAETDSISFVEIIISKYDYSVGYRIDYHNYPLEAEGEIKIYHGNIDSNKMLTDFLNWFFEQCKEGQKAEAEYKKNEE